VGAAPILLLPPPVPPVPPPPPPPHVAQIGEIAESRIKDEAISRETIVFIGVLYLSFG